MGDNIPPLSKLDKSATLLYVLLNFNNIFQKSLLTPVLTFSYTSEMRSLISETLNAKRQTERKQTKNENTKGHYAHQNKQAIHSADQTVHPIECSMLPTDTQT